MSHFIPNTVVAIFRDGTPPDGADAWGNPVPPADPGPDQANVKDLPALLTEFSRRVWQPAEGRADNITLYRLRLRPGAAPFEITTSDRVLDQRSGRFYAVDDTPFPTSPVEAADTRLVLRRVS